ncbi:MAG TPA: PAS domain-containing protein [Rhizomicrobium sp.]
MSVVLGHSLDRSHYGLEHLFKPVEVPLHPSSIRLLAYWQDCEAKGGLRFGRDIPARPIAALLGHIIVSEPIGDWSDARLRLAGFATAEYFGRDVTGSLLSEVVAGDLQMFLTGARKAIAKRRPGIVEHRLLKEGCEVLRQEMGAFPIFAPDGQTNWMLCSTFDF